MIVKTHSVFCDHDGCPMWIAETVDGSAAARRIAQADGWAHLGGRDLCPDHRSSRGGDDD